jgi:hypothetical protein
VFWVWIDTQNLLSDQEDDLRNTYGAENVLPQGSYD